PATRAATRTRRKASAASPLPGAEERELLPKERIEMRPIKSIILATTALTFCAFASTAQAQETAEQKAADEAPAAGDIVVTGTRITRDGYDAPTPTTIVTAEQLDISSPTSVTQG